MHPPCQIWSFANAWNLDGFDGKFQLGWQMRETDTEIILSPTKMMQMISSRGSFFLSV
jgi:hypothetical protein